MALKTFNIDEETYKKYSAHCRENGISMSKQVEKFIAQEVAKVAKISKMLTTSPALRADEHSMKKFC